MKDKWVSAYERQVCVHVCVCVYICGVCMCCVCACPGQNANCSANLTLGSAGSLRTVYKGHRAPIAGQRSAYGTFKSLWGSMRLPVTACEYMGDENC